MTAEDQSATADWTHGILPKPLMSLARNGKMRADPQHKTVSSMCHPSKCACHDRRTTDLVPHAWTQPDALLVITSSTDTCPRRRDHAVDPGLGVLKQGQPPRLFSRGSMEPGLACARVCGEPGFLCVSRARSEDTHAYRIGRGCSPNWSCHIFSPIRPIAVDPIFECSMPPAPALIGRPAATLVQERRTSIGKR